MLAKVAGGIDRNFVGMRGSLSVSLWLLLAPLSCGIEGCTSAISDGEDHLNGVQN